MPRLEGQYGKIMGLSSPIHNIRGYSISRPPVTIFVLCLLLCASATLAMGFYIQYSETILNPEVKGKWSGFLNHLSKIDLCVIVPKASGDPGPITQFIDGGISNITKEVSITVPASVGLVSELKKLPTGMVAASGNLELGDWATFQDSAQPLKSLKMTFVVPPGLSQSNTKNACIILTVPSFFLPLSSRSSVCVPSFLNKTITHVGILSAIDSHGSDPNCKNGAYVKLNFNEKSVENFYLSKVEKWNIYLHLIHVSSFLFIVAIVLLCFSLYRSTSYDSTVTIDKVPLTL